MTHYEVKLETDEWPGSGELVINDGHIMGLPWKCFWRENADEPNTKIFLGEVPPHEAGWNGPGSEAEPRRFYVGASEHGEETWELAVLAVLYNEFQVNDLLKSGDTFIATHPVTGETAHFYCDGVHVMPGERA